MDPASKTALWGNFLNLPVAPITTGTLTWESSQTPYLEVLPDPVQAGNLPRTCACSHLFQSTLSSAGPQKSQP